MKWKEMDISGSLPCLCISLQKCKSHSTRISINKIAVFWWYANKTCQFDSFKVVTGRVKAAANGLILVHDDRNFEKFWYLVLSQLQFRWQIRVHYNMQQNNKKIIMINYNSRFTWTGVKLARFILLHVDKMSKKVFTNTSVISENRKL